MQMKFLCLLTAFIVVTPCICAQRMHLGVFGGASAYTGDLTSKLFPKKVTKGAIGITLNYEISDLLMLRSGVTFAKIGGADRYSDKPNLVLRNLSFETKIFEFSSMLEYNLLSLQYSKYSPYMFAGVAVFKFDSYTYDKTGQKYFLKPLSTEGQGLSGYPDRKPYHLTQIAIPFGGGAKFAINDNLRVGVEFGLRKLFTGYIDDVNYKYVNQADLLAERGQLAVDLSYRSDELIGGRPSYPNKTDQRGDPKSKDYFYFAGIHFTSRLTNSSKFHTGCPVNVY